MCHINDIAVLQGQGESPIWAAIQLEDLRPKATGYTEVVVALVAVGADVKQCRDVTEDGNTPLHAASQQGKAEQVSTLMACNASLTIKNKKEQLPIDVAANDQIRQLINDEMAAMFDHGLKRALMPPPPPAAAELEQEGGEGVGGGAGTVSANATSTSEGVASDDEKDDSEEESSDEEDDNW